MCTAYLCLANAPLCLIGRYLDRSIPWAAVAAAAGACSWCLLRHAPPREKPCKILRPPLSLQLCVVKQPRLTAPAKGPPPPVNPSLTEPPTVQPITDQLRCKQLITPGRKKGKKDVCSSRSRNVPGPSVSSGSSAKPAAPSWLTCIFPRASIHTQEMVAHMQRVKKVLCFY